MQRAPHARMHFVYAAAAAVGAVALVMLSACATSADGSSLGASSSALEDTSACANDPIPSAADTYFEMPTLTASPIDCRTATAAKPPAPGRLSLAFWQMGAAAANAPVTWSVGDVTGLAIDPSARAAWQRGPRDAPQTTAAQLSDDAFGIWIDSSSPDVPFTGDILPVVAHYDFPADRAPKPFADGDAELSFALDAQVPTASRWGEGVSYAATVFRFKDMNATHEGRAVWLSIALFDPRGAADDAIILDGCSTCSGDPILLTSYQRLRRFGSLGPGSATFSATPFSESRHFDFRVAADQLAAALDETKTQFHLTDAQLSGDPADYALVHFNVNPEVSAPGNGARGGGTIGMSARNVRIARFAPTPRGPATRVAVRAANGSRVPELQVFFKTSASDFFDEAKSVRVPFPTGGSEVTVVADFAAHPDFRGTLTGLRIDPFDSRDADACFNVDDVAIEDADGRALTRWTFNGPPGTPAEPFFGWRFFGLDRLWNDGRTWGACADPAYGDPQFFADLALSVGR